MNIDKNRVSNIVVVEKINDQQVRKAMRDLRKQHKLFTNKDMVLFTLNNTAAKYVSKDMYLFGDDFKHPFEIKESNNIKEMVGVFYIKKNKFINGLYLFEIND